MGVHENLRPYKCTYTYCDAAFKDHLNIWSWFDQRRQTALSPREQPASPRGNLDNSIKQEPLPSPPGKNQWNPTQSIFCLWDWPNHVKSPSIKKSTFPSPVPGPLVKKRRRDENNMAVVVEQIKEVLQKKLMTMIRMMMMVMVMMVILVSGP